jgi:diguanylate cyclase (GGDEF)-like protein
MTPPDPDNAKPLEDTPALRDVPDPWQEIARLRSENEDLQLALLTTCEHGDLIEAELAEANARLEAEVAERRRAEEAMRVLLKTVSQQKNDLEALIQILAEHGDQIDQQWSEHVTEIKQLTGIDPLTRIGNRRRLDEYYGEAWYRMTEAGTPLAVILCDIDHFKQFNDHYGHLAGDDCLIRVARAMEESLAADSGLLVRNGGEEFAVVLPGLDRCEAGVIAERMRARVEALGIPHSESTAAPHVTISLGVFSIVPTRFTRPDILFQEADRLLYRAKRDGRNRVVF